MDYISDNVSDDVSDDVSYDLWKQSEMRMEAILSSVDEDSEFGQQLQESWQESMDIGHALESNMLKEDAKRLKEDFESITEQFGDVDHLLVEKIKELLLAQPKVVAAVEEPTVEPTVEFKDFEVEEEEDEEEEEEKEEPKVVAKPKCQGTKKDGTQCAYSATVGAEWCKRHTPKPESESESDEEEKPKCQATKKDGTPCTYSATVGQRCKRHTPKPAKEPKKVERNWGEWHDVEDGEPEDPECDYEYEEYWVDEEGKVVDSN